MKLRPQIPLVAGVCLSALVYAQNQNVTFTKVTTGPIVSDGGGSFGCAWGDFDGDGYLDLFVTNAIEESCFLYRNNRDGTFSRVSPRSPVERTGEWHGATCLDFNNDGRLDLVATHTEPNVVQVLLYRNDGNGTFTAMPSSTFGGVVGAGQGYSQVAAAADYDKDGYVDIFLNRWGSDWLYRNSAEGIFARVASPVSGKAGEDGFSAAWADFNNDGHPDLLVTVTSDPPSRRLYENTGDGSFRQITTGDIATDGGHCFGLGWMDYDNDGYLDLFLVNGDADGTNLLYHNDGGKTLTRVRAQGGRIVTDTGGYDQCAWGDYDNDGYPDLFVTATPGLGGAADGNALYHNNRDGSFTRVLAGAVVEEIANSVGCAWADYDNDGFLDLFVANGGVIQSENNFLFHNEGNQNNWLKIKCVGTVSNRSAIGAKVRVKATINGKTFWQLREISTGSGFCGNPLEVHFGLGDASTVETLRIEWPSGTVQEIEKVPARQFLTVQEPPRLKIARGIVRDGYEVTLTAGLGLAYDLQTSEDLKSWAQWTTVTNTTRTLQIMDTRTAGATHKFYRAVSR